MTSPLPSRSDWYRLARLAFRGPAPVALAERARWPASQRLTRLMLTQAARGGQSDLLRAVVPALRQRRTWWLNRALVRAAQAGHLSAMETLVDLGASPKAFLSDALRAAAARGHTEVVAFLLPRSEIHARHHQALEAAFRGEHLAVVDLILAHPDFQPGLHWPPLVVAARAGRVRMVADLFRRPECGGCHPHPPGWATFLGAAYLRAVEGGHAEVASYLVEEVLAHRVRHRLDRLDRYDLAAFGQALAQSDRADQVHRLIERLLDEREAEVAGQVLLQIVKHFIEIADDRRAWVYLNEMPVLPHQAWLHWLGLHAALSHTRVDLAEQVLEGGHWPHQHTPPEDPDRLDGRDKTSLLEAAVRGGHVPLVQRLLATLTDEDHYEEGLLAAVENNREQILILLLAQQSTFAEAAYAVHQALKLAAVQGHLHLVHHLLGKETRKGQAAVLFGAAKSGHFPVVEVVFQEVLPRAQTEAIVEAIQGKHADLVAWGLPQLDLQRSPKVLEALIEHLPAAPWQAWLAHFDLTADGSQCMRTALRLGKSDWVQAIAGVLDVRRHAPWALLEALQHHEHASIECLIPHVDLTQERSRALAEVARVLGEQDGHGEMNTPTWKADLLLPPMVSGSNLADVGDWLIHWGTPAAWVGLEALSAYAPLADLMRWLDQAPEGSLPKIRAQVRALQLQAQPPAALVRPRQRA